MLLPRPFICSDDSLENSYKTFTRILRLVHCQCGGNNVREKNTTSRYTSFFDPIFLIPQKIVTTGHEFTKEDTQGECCLENESLLLNQIIKAYVSNVITRPASFLLTYRDHAQLQAGKSERISRHSRLQYKLNN